MQAPPDEGDGPQSARPSAAALAATRRCPVCRGSAPADARKCLHCGSFFGWRGLFAPAQTTLALLIALLGVASATLPPLAGALSRWRSPVEVLMAGVSEDAINVLVINRDKRPLSLGSFELSFGTQRTDVFFLALAPDTNPDPLVMPGETRRIVLRVASMPKRILWERYERFLDDVAATVTIHASRSDGKHLAVSTRTAGRRFTGFMFHEWERLPGPDGTGTGGMD